MTIELAFATPRKLPKAAELRGRVAVLDIAFASEAGGTSFEKVTEPFIRALGSRLAVWVDHHDHDLHARFRDDPRFVLATKAEHGACPEMVTSEVVTRAGDIQTIVCHTDFDGLCSAAKWIRRGEEPYVGADDDARAIDTRIGKPSTRAERIDRAIRAKPRDHALLGLIVRHLSTGLADDSLWSPIDEAASLILPREEASRKMATAYALVDVVGKPWRRVAFVDAAGHHGSYDKTLLLLLGQERADVSVVADRDTVSCAAAFDSGFNFLNLLGFSGGMPTLVSISRSGVGDLLTRLGIGVDDRARLGA